jgi:hypothetical protein
MVVDADKTKTGSLANLVSPVNPVNPVNPASLGSLKSERKMTIKRKNGNARIRSKTRLEQSWGSKTKGLFLGIGDIVIPALC